MDVWIAAGLFVLAYVLIAFEPIDRTLIALLAGMLVVVLGVIDQNRAFQAIDLNVVLLLTAMMVMAGILARTGLFAWVAVRCVRLSGGRPLVLLVLLTITTAFISAFVNNVTTVVLTVPVTLVVAQRLGVSPIPYLIAQVLASNIGGTATLIGDPPNIMIGSAAGLDFNDFAFNLAPISVVILVATVGLFGFVFRGRLEVPAGRREAAVEATEAATITDLPLLRRALVVVAATLVGFVFHQALGLEIATVALLGATTLMVVGRIEPHDAFRDVDWRTIFFFVGLFVLVEAVVAVGIVGGIGQWLAANSRGDALLASLSILWASAGVSALVDNIPYTATAIPIVHELVASGLPAQPLWWSLALGACLGGNLTLVGASANVVVANMAAREGYPITFGTFLRYGVVVTLGSLLLSSAYVWLRYFA
jgi:Na+/H+ antiporter NhaD/arsenite permease-like protein